MQLTVVVGADLTLHPWRHNSSIMLGVSLRARRDAIQVMLGCHCGPGETHLYIIVVIIITIIIITIIIVIRTTIPTNTNINNKADIWYTVMRVKTSG